MNGQIIDSHTHLDLIYQNHPQRTAWMQANGYIPISWAFCPGVKDRHGLLGCLRAQADLIRELNRDGLECYYLAGIHPRSITPDLRAGEVAEILMPFVEDPLCLGMGEIGLETGTEIEAEILRAQLGLADSLMERNKKIGVHTPRENKPAVTRKTLELLGDFPAIKPITVIDHCSPETIGRVLEEGYRAGITVSPVKASPADLGQIVAGHPQALDKIMCNTDSGVMFYEDLFDFYAADKFPVAVRKALAFENAYAFFIG